MAQYFEGVLTDAWEGVWLDTYELASESFIGYDGPEWAIEKSTLTGGKQQGVDVVHLDNGCMTVVICPTRGMGILEAFTDQASLGWDSPVREVVHPAFVREETRGCYWRTDFPEPDNATQVRNIIVRKTEDGPSLTEEPPAATRITEPGTVGIGAGCFGYIPRD